MKRLALLVLLTPLAGCGMSDAPAARIPSVCEDQVYADPLVKDLIMKGAGSTGFARNHENQLQAAKQDAATRCLQAKGLIRPGGVERQRVEN
jgi:hypothetical protein